MLVRVFTLRFNPATERFDDSAVAGFLADKEVLSISDHFFVKDDVPYLALQATEGLPALRAPVPTHEIISRHQFCHNPNLPLELQYA